MRCHVERRDDLHPNSFYNLKAGELFVFSPVSCLDSNIYMKLERHHDYVQLFGDGRVIPGVEQQEAVVHRVKVSEVPQFQRLD